MAREISFLFHLPLEAIITTIIQVIYFAITTCYLCVPMPAAARPRQQAYNDLSECCAHEGEAGADKSAKELSC